MRDDRKYVSLSCVDGFAIHSDLVRTTNPNMRDTLLDALSASASADAVSWLRGQISELSENFEKHPFYYAFSGVSRRFDKAATIQSENDTIVGWDEFRTARVALLLVLAEKDKDTFLESFSAVLNTADIREQIALFSALRWMPHQEDLVESAVDGLRSNIVDIYDSIALDNPFPQEHFTDEAWTQMVLKAIFISRPLHRIHGIEARRNQALAEAISDLAHERWAAGRVITPEAWRSCIGFIDERIAGDIAKMAESENPDDRAAAALVVAEEESGKLESWNTTLADELSKIETGDLSWKSLGQEMEDKTIRKSLT